MKRRVRWFLLEATDEPLSALAKRMIQNEYSAEEGSGFRIDESTRQHTRGSYIEKFETQEQIEDPFGKVVTIPRLEYRRVSFHLTNTSPNLEVFDPPRSCKSFVARIGLLMKHRISVEPVHPKVEPWLKSLEATVGHVKVTSMSVGDVSLSSSTRADVIVFGANDVRREAKQLLGDRPRVVSSVDLLWTKGERTFTCELSSSGATYPADLESDLGSAVRTALQQSMGTP